MSIKINKEVFTQIQGHGEAAYPEEGAGLLLGVVEGEQRSIEAILRWIIRVRMRRAITVISSRRRTCCMARRKPPPWGWMLSVCFTRILTTPTSPRSSTGNGLYPGSRTSLPVCKRAGHQQSFVAFAGRPLGF